MKKRIVIGLGVVALSMGFVAGASSLRGAAPSEVDAAVPAGKSAYDVFVDAKDAPGYTSGGDVYCYNWGVAESPWPGTKMTRISGTLYGATLANSGNKNVLFNLGDGNDSHKTPDLTVQKDNTYFWKEGSWVNRVDYRVLPDEQSPSLNTFRIFINNSDVSDWNSSKARTMVRVTDSTTYSDYDGAIYDLSWFGNEETGASGRWYGYADIPTDAGKFQVVRVSDWGHGWIWNWGPEVVVTSGVAHGARTYVLAGNWGSGFSFSGVTSDSAVGPAMMENILSAYTTCDMSVLNGVGAYASLNSNFFAGATADAKNRMMTTLGDGAVSAKASVHIAAMAARQGGIPKANIVNRGISTNNSALLIGGLALVGLAAAGTMIFIAKKRKEN